MGSMLPWWILIAPAILVILDSMMSPKTTAMTGRADGTTKTTAY